MEKPRIIGEKIRDVRRDVTLSRGEIPASERASERWSCQKNI